MIAYLQGTVFTKISGSAVILVGGVGYRVSVSLTTFEKLPGQGERVTLHIYTHVREDAIQLFGFLTEEEREVFEVLISVSGIGPRAAIGILGGVDVRELARAICNEDVDRLCMIPGIGKKKAERMVLELKDRLLALSRPQEKEFLSSNLLDDLRSALSNLGFTGSEIERAVAGVKKKFVAGANLDQLLESSLKLLRG
jgi:Holliday junction DNA helicase RuvA